jgi:methionyl-tRNA formyltransferase
MDKLKVFLSGQKYFGGEVLRLLLELDYVEVVGVCSPIGDRNVTKIAINHQIKHIPAGMLNGDTLPEDIDLGITAHSFDYIGKRTRYKTRLGWIGYHPSLLPRHRGRSSIEWAVRMRDPITGGTIFWLNGGIDRGDIAYQEFIHIDPKLYGIDPKKASKILWEHYLQEIGLRLFKLALNDIKNGIIIKKPQHIAFSTFEPNTDVKDVFKPDLLMLEQKGSAST